MENKVETSSSNLFWHLWAYGRVGFNGERFSDCLIEQANCSDYDFSGCEFEGVHFEGVDFSKASLKGCSFQGCLFSKCRLRYSDLSDTKLYSSEMIDCQLSHAKFEGADSFDFKFTDCIGKKLDFEDSDMCGTEFIRCNLVGSNFKDSVMNNCSFEECILTSSDFKRASLQYATFPFTVINDCNLAEAIGTPIYNGAIITPDKRRLGGGDMIIHKERTLEEKRVLARKVNYLSSKRAFLFSSDTGVFK